MAKLPAPQQYIGRGLDLPGQLKSIPAECCNPTCDAPWYHLHHIVRRSYLNGPYDWVELFGRVWLNLAPVCRSCHDHLEQNRAIITAHMDGNVGYYLWSGERLSPYPNPVLEDGESAGVFPPFHAEPGSAGSPSSSTVTPGETCPQCQRRVPHPRKPSSPKTKVYGMRVPLDEAETFAELVDSAAEYVGIKDQAHHKFRTISLAVAHLLQDEGLRGFGRR